MEWLLITTVLLLIVLYVKAWQYIGPKLWHFLNDLRVDIDQLEEDCGNCDNCLDPPRLIDGTNLAVMLLSSVHQTGQSFGQAHVIDVVRGANTQKILEREHHEIPPAKLTPLGRKLAGIDPWHRKVQSYAHPLSARRRQRRRFR